MNRRLLLTLFLVGVLTPSVHGIMVEIPYEQLWEESDTIVLGTVTGITHHGTLTGTIYRIVTLSVERFYKNPLDAETLFIRVEGGELGPIGVWVEDQPEFSVCERTLVFLAETDQTHEEETVYRVYGLFQGKFTVEGDVAHAPGGVYLNISGLEFQPMPEGNVVLAELVIPGNRTVYEVIYGRIGFINTGGQGSSRNVTVTYRGVQGPCEGYVNGTTMWVGVGPGGYTGSELRLNFTLPGVYVASVDAVPATTFTIHEAGYMNEGYRFSSLSFDPPEPGVGQTVNVSFRVSTTMDAPSECIYMLKILPPDAMDAWDNPLSIPMMSLTSPGEAAVNWYSFHPDATGAYRVVVWHRGLRVLDETITVAAAPETGEPPEERPTEIPGSPASALLAGAAIAALIRRRRR
jgi:hypothetical protein